MTKHSGLTILLFIFFFFLYDLKQPQRLEKLDKTVFDFYLRKGLSPSVTDLLMRVSHLSLS